MSSQLPERQPDIYSDRGVPVEPSEPDRLAALSIDLAERVGALQAEAGEANQLLRAQAELVNVDNPARFHLAQRRLESGSQWTDETRELALEINRADQEERGEKPLSFDEAKAKLANWTESDLKSTDTEQKRQALQRDSALRGTTRPEVAVQLESLDTLLQEVEQLLHAYEQNGSARTPLLEADLREYRAIRDAILVKQGELKADAERQAQEKIEGVEREERTAEAREKVAQARGETGQISLEGVQGEQPGLEWELLKGQIEKAGAYNQYKGAEAVMIAAQESGVDLDRFSGELMAAKQKIAAESARQHPEKPPEAHEAFAVKRLLEQIDRIPEYKKLREALNRFADANSGKLGETGERMITDEKYMTDFIRSAEELAHRKQ